MQKNKQCFGLRTIHNITFNAAKHCVRLSSNKQMKSIRIMRNFIMLKTNTRPPAKKYDNNTQPIYYECRYKKLNDGIDHCL